MPQADHLQKSITSDGDLAQAVIRIAEAAQARTIICLTESGSLARHLSGSSGRYRIIAATASRETYESLTTTGMLTLRLPFHGTNKFRHVRHVLSVAVGSNDVSVGEMVVCAAGLDVYPGEASFVLVTEVESILDKTVIADLLRLTDGILPEVLESTLTIASRIGRAARRGKEIGAIFMLGDSLKVLRSSKQLIPNPFEGHDQLTRSLTNPAIHDALVELSKLDGAFVIRSDGFIETAGAFLAVSETDLDLPVGLGARHAAAAAATARTAATGIVVSATDGNVRMFSGGRLVLRLDPDIDHGPIRLRM